MYSSSTEHLYNNEKKTVEDFTSESEEFLVKKIKRGVLRSSLLLSEFPCTIFYKFTLSLLVISYRSVWTINTRNNGTVIFDRRSKL